VVKTKKEKIGYIRIGKRKIHFLHLILIGIGLFFLIHISAGTIQTAFIAKNGIVTKGKIVDIRKIGSKGNREYYYQFSYKEKTYSGKTIYLSKKIGDEVEVIFIQDNPNKNKLIERLENTYKFFLKNNKKLK